METKTGFIDDVSDSQMAVLQAARRFIYEEMQVTDKLRWNDWYILRFCRARKFDIVKIKEMIQNYLKWLVNMKFDKVNEIDIDNFAKLREFSGYGYYNTDKKGRPIYIDQVRNLKVKEVFENYKDEELMAYYIQSYDRLIHVIFPECSRAANKRIEQTCTIMDLKDVNAVKLFTGKIKAFSKIASDIAQDYYPEILGTMYILNAGFLFSGIWMVMKHWFDAKTQAKINIISGSGKKELALVIDLENLPVFLGGLCTRDVREDHGPWSEALERSYQRKSVYHDNQELVNQYFHSEAEKEEDKMAKAKTAIIE
jgi:hypothetical protein